MTHRGAGGTAGEARARAASLQDIIERAASIPLPAALLMLDDIMAALARLHATGSTHGALRPAAILVDHHGHCRLRYPRAPDGSVAPGSPSPVRYAAPEWRSGGAPDARGDVYSATAVFVESVTGLPPDLGRDVIASASGQASEALPENPLPPAVRALADQGMATDPSARPAAERFREALVSTSDRDFAWPDWRSRGRAWLSSAAAAAGATSERPAVAGAASPAVTGPLATYGDRRDVGTEGTPRSFVRLRRDPRVLAGAGAATVGFLLVVIGASIGLHTSGPRSNVAAPQVTASAAPSAGSSSAGISAPPAIGSSMLPVPSEGAPAPSALPTTNVAPATVPPSATPTDTGGGLTFTPIPAPGTLSPTATPAPTPTPSCIILC